MVAADFIYLQASGRNFAPTILRIANRCWRPLGAQEQCYASRIRLRTVRGCSHVQDLLQVSQSTSVHEQAKMVQNTPGQPLERSREFTQPQP